MNKIIQSNGRFSKWMNKHSPTLCCLRRNILDTKTQSESKKDGEDMQPQEGRNAYFKYKIKQTLKQRKVIKKEILQL